MGIKTLKTLAACLALPLFLYACGAAKANIYKRISVENKTIPPDFGKDQTTLIVVMLDKKGHDKIITKIVEENYHGSYEFVLRDNLKLKKYNDSAKYRYIFNMTYYLTTEREYQASGGSTMRRVPNYNFHVLDKQTDIDYEYPKTEDFFKPIVKAYMVSLEKLRLENQKK